MRSDKVLARLIKLWISVWNLVLEEKRHAETVTAVLQKIIFEERGYPLCKNWPEICKLGEEDSFHLIMIAVATVDLYQRDERVEQLVAAFPQCFCSTQTYGPYPLSVIRANAERMKRQRGEGSGGGDHPISYGAFPADVPLLGFDKFGNNQVGSDLSLLPSSIDPRIEQGEVVSWEDKNFVVLENNDDCEELWLVPAELIRVDL
jgi:hypothetical protein